MLMQLTLQINGASRRIEVDPDRMLLSVLRDELGLTGTKYGCGDGKCGACTVLVDRQPVQSCSITVGAAAGSQITTVEGLAQGGRMHALQAAFLAEGAFQCGYCTPGMIMASVALLEANPNPTRAEMIRALQDNICRCGSYQRILAAVAHTAAQLQAQESETLAVAPTPAASPTAAAPEPPNEGIFVAYPDPDVAVTVYGEDAVPPPPETRPLLAIGPWVHIAPDGAITLYVGKTEVGQNIRTSFAQIVAQELRVPADAVQVVMADTARVPYDVGTFGSRTTPITGPQLWRVGATARMTLLELAAATWGVEAATLTLTDSAVHHAATGRSATFGELARDRQIMRIAEDDAPVTPPAAWTVAGQSAAKHDGQSFVTGRHHFTVDMALPEMLHGKVLRPPAFGATLTNIDINAAEVMDGVTVVMEGEPVDAAAADEITLFSSGQRRAQEERFVGVTAGDEFTATRAVEAIRAAWRIPLQVSQGELFEYLKTTPVEIEGWRGPYIHEVGSVAEALADAHLTWQQRYTVDYIAHVPLEPHAALAHWKDGHLTVWTGSQRPFAVCAHLAAAFGLAEGHVRVIAPDTGAGYGGKHDADAAIEAARLARAVGKPVKVVWTRQEEFTWAYFRPAGLIEVEAGVDQVGHITALEFHNYNSGAAGINTLYTIPNQHIEYHPADSPLRQGAYRALSATANHFARESLLDELAHALELDPLAMRLLNLREERMKAVLMAAADAFGWGHQAPAANHGHGIAGGFEKRSYVAACVEVYVNPANNQPKVVRVVEAFDCGALITPDNVRSQVEGAIVQGVGGALFESIRFANGRILNPNFAGYRVPRFADLPQIETILIDRKEVPSAGAGETPIIAIAPAIGNAIFQATGVRLRSLPLAPHGVPR